MITDNLTLDDRFYLLLHNLKVTRKKNHEQRRYGQAGNKKIL